MVVIFKLWISYYSDTQRIDTVIFSIKKQLRGVTSQMPRQTASSSSVTTINAWSVVRARTMYAVFFHAIVLGMAFTVLRGDWNILLGTQYGFSSEQALLLGISFCTAILMIVFVWKRTPAYLGGGYESHKN